MRSRRTSSTSSGAGDQLEVRGPIGGWFTWERTTGGPLLLVAGGSGVVPLMSILRHRVAAGSDAAVRLLASWRTRSDIIFAAELERLGAGGVAITHTLTRDAPAAWTGHRGRIDEAMLGEVDWPPTAARWPSCAGRPGSSRRSRPGSSRSATRPTGSGPSASARLEAEMDADLVLDGNALAGVFSELFMQELTMAKSTCGACGLTARSPRRGSMRMHPALSSAVRGAATCCS